MSPSQDYPTDHVPGFIVQEAEEEYLQNQPWPVQAPGIWEDGYALSIPAKIIADQRLSHAALRFLLALTTYCRKDRGMAWPKEETISQEFGFSVRRIKGYVAELKRLGYISVTFTGRYNVYHLSFLEKSARQEMASQECQKWPPRGDKNGSSKEELPRKITKEDNDKNNLSVKLSVNLTESFTEDQIHAWRVAHPGLDLHAEWAKAVAWLMANPHRKKKRLSQFFNNWLNRAGDGPRVDTRTEAEKRYGIKPFVEGDTRTEAEKRYGIKP